MNSNEIRTYNELHIDEKDMLDTIRTMKLNHNQVRFELYFLLIEHILLKYENFIEMRKDTQALLFEIIRRNR